MSWPFVQARNYTPVTGHRPARLVVIHTMEAPEKPDTAEAVARWFAGPHAPRASAHLCVDADSVVQCVRLRDVAWAAPGANRDGVQIELAGRAAQGAAGWRDPYSQAVLRWASCAVAELVALSRFAGQPIPVRHVTATEIVAGKSGICGHVDVTRAYHRSTHTDPGPDFPWPDFLTMVAWWLPRIDRIDWR
ncbi:MAG: hypothetical protein KatS3mg014_2448 [Actinomycetota bacterium]|nr:MAG: hypothetical protein KatS3mg014_2448 [Actinomycetota bacterium]